MKISFKISVLVLVIFALFFIPIIIFSFSLMQNGTNEKIINPIDIGDSSPSSSLKQSKLKEITDRDLGESGDYAVVIKNLKSGEQFKLNEDKEFNSASLYKLWIMAVALGQINDNELDKSQIMTGDLDKFDETLSTITSTPTPENSSGEQSVEEKEPRLISMTVGDALERMITYSDNYAALLLTQKVGAKNVSNFLKKYGFNNSSFGSPPKTTANDIASFYEQLYNGKIIDKSNSDEMIDILKKQTFNDRIPKYLPEKIEVAHKTGELLGAKHDAGIIFTDKGDYLVVVMSQTENESVAAEKIANFSEDIFNYFNEEN